MSATSSAAAEWSAVAEAWDGSGDYVDEHSSQATQALVEALQVRSGDRLLELAAGPGTLTGTWSRLVGKAGFVTVSDIAPGMVEVAARRGADLPNVEFDLLDLEAVDRPDGSFDAVACRMGYMFAADSAAAFAETRRVLRAGGRLGALTWGPPERNPWMTCVGMSAMANGIVAGGLPTAPGGIFSLGDQATLEILLTGGGFTNVTVDAIDVMFRSPSIEAHIARVSSLAGPLAAAFAAASDEQLAAVRQTASQLAADYRTEGGYSLPGRALLASAVASKAG